MSPTGFFIRFAALAAIVLHLAAPHLPEESAWSVWPYTSLPTPLGWLGALAVASLILSPVNDALGQWLHKLWTALPAKEHKRRWFAGIAIIMAIPFWIFRIRHVRWGDANFIVQALSYTGPDRPVWTIYNWQSPLTIFTHAQLWLLLNPTPGIGVDTLYAITSVLSGVGFVYILLLLADLLGQDRLEKITIFGLVATTGAMQLFFGYVENYTIISLGIMSTLYLSVRCLRQETSLVWPSLALAITNAFHPSTIVLWPGIIYVGWQAASKHVSGGIASFPNRSKVIEWAKLALPPILVFATLAALMTFGGHGPGSLLVDDRPGGADGIPFVPLFQTTTKWQHYTMFSLAHLLDWANEHFLISPFGLPLLLLALATQIVRGKSVTRTQSQEDASTESATDIQTMDNWGIIPFLIIASLAYLLLTFVWNPDYGGRRDWDLFAPSAFVYTLLAAYLLIYQSREDSKPSGEKKHALAQASRLLIPVSALHTIAWVYYNTIPGPPV